MDQETFNKKMDELDRKNPRPIKNFYSAERIADIAASAAAPQVVADERAAHACWACKTPVTMSERSNADGDCPHCGSELDLDDWPLAATPVQAQEPVIWYDARAGAVDAGLLYESTRSLSIVGSSEGPFGHFTTPLYRAPVQPVAVPDAQIVLSGHQLRMALDLINPGGPDERDELDDQLLFGIRQHRDDDGKVSTDMCCWNGDTDGVLPLDGEYEFPAAPAAQGDAKDAERLEFIESGTYDLRCYNDHDDDVYWNVIEHHMAAPIEREIGWGNTARQAIDAAIAAKAAS